ncbi:MAG: HAMP domain-containing histidine kinase, partial [Oscillospiraceae bacterium]|nr:HAMP domain-containing histidine kinase [Oscillospiraceae bacterium]
AEKTDLVNLAESCAEKLRGLIINQEKEIKVICPENKKIYINCREEAVMRALMNVTANCVQYAESLVEILFYETDKSVSVRVRDDGPGIDASDLPNIFKRFYKGKEGKHGIGLSIAKSVAERHGAKITAGNRSDVSGAEFIIEFIKN